MAFNQNHPGAPVDGRLNTHTPITLALEGGDFLTAERLIASGDIALHGYSLDDGPPKMIPLSFVLAYDTRPWHLQVYKQHFGLAKLLVEKGANPNIRIPSSNWRGASRSPIEVLVNMIQDTKKKNVRESVIFSATVGLNNEEVTTDNRRAQLLELLDIFLVCGANPNVTTNNGNATVYHVSMAQVDLDIELILKLSNFGGDLHQTNIHGTTALMDLIKYAEGDLSMDILNEIWHIQPDQQISSLLAQNCNNETAIWRAVFAGSIQVAIELLKRGADCSISAGVCGLGASYGDRTKLAPIFSPLLQDSYAYRNYTNRHPKLYNEYRKKIVSLPLMNKIIANSITPIVDSEIGYKCFPDNVLLGLEKMVTGMTRFKTVDILSPAINPRDVPFLMFGKLKAGLQQMCVRVIMEEIMTKQSKITRNIKRSVNALDSLRVATLVTNDLCLPASLVPLFNIEAARLQLGFALRKGKSFSECHNDCDIMSDDEEDDSLSLRSESDDDDDDFYGDIFDSSDDSFYENWMEMADPLEESEVVVNEDEAKAEDDDEWQTISDASDDHDPYGPPNDSDDDVNVWWVSESFQDSTDDNEWGVDRNNTDSEFGWD